MSAIALGLVAALCWGLHDITIRRISQTAPLMATLLGVLVVGTVFQAGVMAVSAGFTALPARAVWLSVAAGVAFLLASVALYNAFQRGPVRVVAPVIGSYPILSVGYASLTGAEVSPWQWAAVLGVVAGIAIVAITAQDQETDTPPLGPTIALSALAAVGFFATFALGHAAASLADDLPSILITRIVSVLLLVPLMLVLGLRFWPGRAAVPFVAIMGVLDGIALLCVLSAGDLPGAQYAAVGASTFGMITVVLARFLLSETMTRAQWLGCSLTFACIGYLAL